MRDFYRIRRLPPYVFEEVNKVKARLRAEGVDVIDFGMGNPDMATAPHIVDKLIETVKSRRPMATAYQKASMACARPWPAIMTAAMA